MRVLIAGGAGFIGSHIVDEFASHGDLVTVLDGLMPETGGLPGNLSHHPEIRVMTSRVEACADLVDVLNTVDLTIDCMGWTRHLLALKNPIHDLELNVSSHLTLLNALSLSNCRNIIYLGSRGQYGNATTPIIDEDHPQIPVDVQGIHKAAAESHMRVFSKLHKLNVVSLRFSNTYGERQPMNGSDIGLFGSFLSTILNDQSIELFGRSRMRDFLHAPDLAKVVHRIASMGLTGFQPFNVAGTYLEIESVIQTMIAITGTGRYTMKDFPEEIRMIDVGNAALSDARIRSHIGDYHVTDIADGIRTVIHSLNAT
jgi:nucleoside-diphosphate-sugar epimerase